MKNKPLRRCLVTQESFPKENLFRVVKTPNGEVVLDITGKLNGRGAYILKSLDVIEKAKKSKCLDRALEVEVPEKVYDKMLHFID